MTLSWIQILVNDCLSQSLTWFQCLAQGLTYSINTFYLRWWLLWWASLIAHLEPWYPFPQLLGCQLLRVLNWHLFRNFPQDELYNSATRTAPSSWSVQELEDQPHLETILKDPLGCSSHWGWNHLGLCCICAIPPSAQSGFAHYTPQWITCLHISTSEFVSREPVPRQVDGALWLSPQQSCL